MSGKESLEDLDVEERVADLRPAGAGQDQRREPAEDEDGRDRRDRLARGAPARAAPRRARRGGPPSRSVRCRRRLLEDRSLGRSLIHCFSISGSSPDSLSSSIAAETQAVSGESFSSSAPHWSPPGAANWPTRSPRGPATAVRKNAVGTSTTTASTWPCLSAVTTSLEVSKTCGSSSRLDRLVDRVEARGADLDADRGVGEVVERGRVGGVGVLERDDRLLGLVVGARRSRPARRASGVIEIWLTSKSKSFGPGA